MSPLELIFGKPQNQTVQNNTPGINPAAPNPFEILGGGRKGGILNNPLLMNMLAQSGYSTMPTSPLGEFGKAMVATQQQERQAGMNDLQRRFIESQIGLNDARANAPAETPETFTQLTEDEEIAAGLPTDKSYQRNDVTGKISAIGSSGVTVNTGATPATSIFTAPSDVRGTFEARREAALSSQVKRQMSGEVLRLLNEDNAPFTGAAAGIKEAGARLFDVMASPDAKDADIIAAREALANTEAMDSKTGVMVGQIIRLFGSGTGLSDADREFAKQIAGALRKGSSSGLKQILQGHFDTATKEIERYNEDIGQLPFPDTSALFRNIDLKNFQVPDGPPPGITSEVWAEMTPEQKALFN